MVGCLGVEPRSRFPSRIKSPVHNRSANNPKNQAALERQAFNTGAFNRGRTCDLTLIRGVLYQLSYERKKKDDGPVVAFSRGAARSRSLPIPGPGRLPPPPEGCAVRSGACSLPAKRLRLSHNPFHDHCWHGGAPCCLVVPTIKSRPFGLLHRVSAAALCLASLAGFEPAFSP